VRDISVRQGDLAIATHGRAFWILDDIAPLRELAADASPDARLFAPRDAVRIRPYSDEAEASPPEVPAGENPPYGAAIDYVRAARRARPGHVADHRRRRQRAARLVERRRRQAGRSEYRRLSRLLARTAGAPVGAGRDAALLVDLHAAASATGRRRRGGDGPFVPPGRYAVRLTIDGRAFTRSLLVRRDPRMPATDADLRAQYALARDVDALLARVQAAIAQGDALRAKPGADAARIDAVAGAPPSRDPRNSVGEPATSFTTLRWYAGALGDLFGAVESADTAPTTGERATWSALRVASEHALRSWDTLRGDRS